MFIRQYTSGREAGDTIVEVLIATVVVMLVLGGAYATTNRSLQATRASQERTIALKLAESQIEQIKGLASNTPNDIFGGTAPTTFCISQATSKPVVTVALDLTTGQPIGTGFDPACAMNAAGAPTSTEPIFRLSITRSTNDFTLTETWGDVSGRMYDNIQLRYRIYD